MKFPIAAVLFLCASFIFFICWAVTSYFVYTMSSALSPFSTLLAPEGQTDFNSLLTNLPLAFGIICAIFFITGILLIFVLESWSDEPEYYYR